MHHHVHQRNGGPAEADEEDDEAHGGEEEEECGVGGQSPTARVDDQVEKGEQVKLHLGADVPGVDAALKVKKWKRINLL